MDGALERRTSRWPCASPRRHRLHGVPARCAFAAALLLAACHGLRPALGGARGLAWAGAPSRRFVTIGKPVTDPCVLRLLTPKPLAAAIIGKGGAGITEMCESAQARIGLSGHDELYPGTESEVLTAQANSEEALDKVSAQVIAKLSECAQADSGELKLQVLMPKAAVVHFVGKGGARIAELCESSNARITVAKDGGADPGSERLVTIEGTQQGLEQVMGKVNRQVQALNQKAWFTAWAEGRGDAAGRAQKGQKAMQLVQVALQLPQRVTEDTRAFTQSCVVPESLVPALIGKGGAGIQEVASLTGTRIYIKEIPGEADKRSLSISGPVASTCTAYMLMMERYFRGEERLPEGQGGRGRATTG